MRREKSTFISRLAENFGSVPLQHSPSERKVLQDAFFHFVSAGNIAYVQKWLTEGWGDILMSDKKGKNVFQIFCQSVGLSENRWNEPDFNPKMELSEKSLLLYDILKERYTVALREKNVEQMDFLKRQVKINFVYPQKFWDQTKYNTLEYLCLLPKETFLGIKSSLSEVRFPRRRMVQTRRFFRKIIPAIRQKNRT